MHVLRENRPLILAGRRLYRENSSCATIRNIAQHSATRLKSYRYLPQQKVVMCLGWRAVPKSGILPATRLHFELSHGLMAVENLSKKTPMSPRVTLR
jgi:hypothetical protein